MPQTTMYHCQTQREESPPDPIFAGTTGSNEPDGPDCLVVGFEDIVPRWDVTQPGGRTLQYFVQLCTFPSEDTARSVAKSFQDAANSWNDLNLGIHISETTKLESANFYLVYKGNQGSNKGTLARAFFPHEVNKDVIVFGYALHPKNVHMLHNIFQHEIGHILGLRHEFAIAGDAAGNRKPEVPKAVQFLEGNPISIMSYNMPPTMQDSDKTQVYAFYRLAEGTTISGIPIQDFQPRTRKENTGVNAAWICQCRLGSLALRAIRSCQNQTCAAIRSVAVQIWKDHLFAPSSAYEKRIMEGEMSLKRRLSVRSCWPLLSSRRSRTVASLQIGC